MAEFEYVLPEQIESRSFEIIEEELISRGIKLKPLDSDRDCAIKSVPVYKRVIHTTADFDYAENLIFSNCPPAILLLGSFSIEFMTARGPLVSAPRQGEAPSFNGLPASRPSGVAPTSKPLGTYDVMLLVDIV